MEILDSPLSAPESKPIWSTVLRYGLFCGVGYILGAQTLFHLGVDESSSKGVFLYTLSFFLVTLFLAYLSIKKQRDQLDGQFIGAGKAVSVSILTFFLGLLILDIWNYVFLTIINPDYLSRLQQQITDQWSGKTPQDELNRALDQLDSMRSFTGILRYSLVYQSPIGIIVGGVVALFMARKFRT